MEEVKTAELVEKKPGEVVDISKLSPEERKKVDEIAAKVDLTDSSAVIQYGVGAQTRIAEFSDSVLETVRNKDAGYVGQVMGELMLKVKEIDVDSLSGEKKGLAAIPFIGGLIDAGKKFAARYEKLSVSIEKIVDELEKSRLGLLKDVTMLDTMYQKNLEYMQELEFFIAAGQIKIKELREKTIPELQAKAQASGDPLDAQKANDIAQMVERFDKKVHDLALSRMIAIQAAPQLRLIQNNDQLLVEKIQSSILNTIPLWKNQIVIAISLFRQQKALEMQKEISRTTNDLLLKNSEMLKQNTLETAKENEKGIVELETLKKVNADLISTIEETLKIQEEGRAKRRAAETELVQIEKDLKDRLANVKKGS